MQTPSQRLGVDQLSPFVVSTAMVFLQSPSYWDIASHSAPFAHICSTSHDQRYHLNYQRL